MEPQSLVFPGATSLLIDSARGELPGERESDFLAIRSRSVWLSAETEFEPSGFESDPQNRIKPSGLGLNVSTGTRKAISAVILLVVAKEFQPARGNQLRVEYGSFA